MKYALGNMLNGAGGLNPDGLSLDLQFAVDKTLTARKGPTPVFTRGSSATQVGASGLIEFAPENLIPQSEGFSTTSWQKSGSTITADSIVSPSGSLTADLFNEDSGLSAHITQQSSPFLIAGQSYSFSVFAKAGSHTSFQMALSNTAFGGGLFANFVLTGSGSVGTSSGLTTSIQSYPDGWYRCSITIASVVGGSGGFTTIVANANNSSAARLPSYQGTGTQVVYLWGAQLEAHPTARTYIPTTTAAVYGPRFDHDPVTLACKGLLIEEQRQNLILQSEDFGTTWTATQSTVSTNVATAPNGLVTADKIIPNLAAGALSRVAQVFTLTGAHTMSVFAKASEWGWILISYGPIANTGVWFDLTNGTIGTQTAGLVGSIIPYGNGWYKCIVAFTGAGTSLNARFRAVNADNESTLGDGTSGVFVWGAQLEAGAFPTSYIPTTTASLARSADVCSITGSDFSGMYNQPEGTLVTSSTRASTNTNAFIGHYSDNSFNNGFDIRYVSSTQVTPLMNVANSSQLTGMQVTITAGSVVKQAFSYKLNDCGYSVNGTATITDTSALIPTATRMAIGNAAVPAAFLYLNGTISSMRYFKKRLANAKLQALTV
jgi:hypothetical protein